MDYARQQRDPARHMIGIAFVILVHALVVWALMSGLGKNIVQIIKKPLNATIIEEVKLPPPPPPPPPKKIIEQPKVADAGRDVRAAARHPGADDVDGAGDLRGHADRPDRAARDRAAATVVAPPAPPKPAVRRGVVRLSGDDPSYPREAIRAGVAKGRVVARLQIDEKGNVTEVNITVSDPPRVFDKVVRAALEGWKFKAEGERYVGEVEINFTLKDE